MARIRKTLLVEPYLKAVDSSSKTKLANLYRRFVVLGPNCMQPDTKVHIEAQLVQQDGFLFWGKGGIVC